MKTAPSLPRSLCSLAITLFLSFLALPVFAKDAHETIDLDGLKVAVWLPKEANAPVILFSHGFHGCATQSTFLMEALADAGYAVFAPNHKDATCNNGDSSWLTRPDTPFRNAEKWTDTTYLNRRDDMKKLLSLLPADPRYHGLDWRHVGLAGHSLGGFTVLALGGAWESWHDDRVKAVLALSPYSAPFVAQHTLGGIHVPVMYQGGTHDFAITPGVKKSGGAYDQTPAPKYFIELDGAGHFAWTDMRETYQPIISDYSIAFFDRYLKDKPFPETLTHSTMNVDVKIDMGK